MMTGLQPAMPNAQTSAKSQTTIFFILTSVWARLPVLIFIYKRRPAKTLSPGNRFNSLVPNGKSPFCKAFSPVRSHQFYNKIPLL